jgi:hypothetical protein
VDSGLKRECWVFIIRVGVNVMYLQRTILLLSPILLAVARQSRVQTE